MPALLKGFLEQVARPGFAFKRKGSKTSFASKGLTGHSARVVVTMSMPALLYHWHFRAHSIKPLERNILGFLGIKPVNETLIDMVAMSERDRRQHMVGQTLKKGYTRPVDCQPGATVP